MLTEVQTGVLEGVRAFLADTKFTPPENTDWKALFKESVEQAVALSCLQGLDTATMPEEVQKAWQNYAMRSLRSNVRIHEQHAYLHELMKKSEIPYVILKGSASAYYYADPLMRSMGDVDFFVLPENIDRATEWLKAEGFTPWEEDHACHIVLKKENIHLEMHFEPAGVPEGALGDIIREYLSDTFERSCEAEISGNVFQMPTDFHHGLIILMHTYHHMLAEGVGIRHLCDWAVFVKHFEGEQFADVFQEKLSKVGLWRYAQIMSYLCHRYLGIPRCEWMGEQDDGYCEALMTDILAGGNFGEKDETRSVQGLSISNRGKGGVKKRSGLAQVIISANAAGKIKYHRMAKIPLLKHFCFIPLGFRYTFRVLTGKRKGLHIAKNMKAAESRKELYQNFKLFEVEE